MKPYPLGIDNPYMIRGEIGSSRWSIYRREDWVKIATFPSQTAAYDARRELLKFEGYSA